MKSKPAPSRKSAANRRNAQWSTGPKTAAGKSIAKLNALKYGLNTPVPDYMVRACADQFRKLLDQVREPSDKADGGGDLVHALASRARLRGHRAELMQMVVEAGLPEDAVDMDALCLALARLGRLETYERKSDSRLGRLLEDRPGALAKRTHASGSVARE